MSIKNTDINKAPDFNTAKIMLQTDYINKFEIEETEERRLYINYVIDESIIDSIGFHILRFNRMDKGIPVEKRKPIILYINSPGGTVSDGLGLVDIIRSSKTPIYTVNQALAASISFLIYLAGDKRFSMPNAEFLMHDGAMMTCDSTAKARDRVEFEGQIEDIIKEYVLSRTSITPELYDQKYRVEWYMLPDEAKKHGIVTHIIGKDVDIDAIL